MNSTTSKDGRITISDRESVILEWCITLMPSDFQQDKTIEEAIDEFRACKKNDWTVSARTRASLMKLTIAGKTKFHSRIQEYVDQNNEIFKDEWLGFEFERGELIKRLKPV